MRSNSSKMAFNNVISSIPHHGVLASWTTKTDNRLSSVKLQSRKDTCPYVSHYFADCPWTRQHVSTLTTSLPSERYLLGFAPEKKKMLSNLKTKVTRIKMPLAAQDDTSLTWSSCSLHLTIELLGVSLKVTVKPVYPLFCSIGWAAETRIIIHRGLQNIIVFLYFYELILIVYLHRSLPLRCFSPVLSIPLETWQ